MRLGRYEDKTEQQLNWWYSALIDYLKEKDMVKSPDCLYAVFVQNKFPKVWEKYLMEVSSD